MGVSDIAVKQLLKDKNRFADLFNGMIFQGEQRILSEELEETESESGLIVTDKSGKERGLQKYRDITMHWKKGADLTILACENQKKVHYAMPVRMMLYDGLSYHDQIRNQWKQRSPQEKLMAEEYLSGFRKRDKIYPVISIVFYYGQKKWDGSQDLYGMFQQSELFREQEFLKAYVPNYKLNLIDVGNVEDVKKFQTDLQVIFGMLKYREEVGKMKSYIKEHEEYFQQVDVETFRAIGELLHARKQMKTMIPMLAGERRVDMCKALDDLYNDGVNQGMERGIQQTVVNMLKDKLSLDKIVDYSGISKEEILKLAQKQNLPVNEA